MLRAAEASSSLASFSPLDPGLEWLQVVSSKVQYVAHSEDTQLPFGSQWETAWLGRLESATMHKLAAFDTLGSEQTPSRHTAGKQSPINLPRDDTNPEKMVNTADRHRNRLIKHTHTGFAADVPTSTEPA